MQPRTINLTHLTASTELLREHAQDLAKEIDAIYQDPNPEPVSELPGGNGEVRFHVELPAERLRAIQKVFERLDAEYPATFKLRGVTLFGLVSVWANLARHAESQRK